MKPVTNTMMLVEDRIAEILESGNLEIELNTRGLLTEKHLDARRRNNFLIRLSTDLAKFDAGVY